MREMKDSGIAWVGCIPIHWATMKNKYLMRKVKDICPKYSGEDILSLTMNGVIIRDLDNPSGKMPTTFDGYQRIKSGNLLMCLFDIDVTPRCVGRILNDGLTSPAYSNFELYGNVSQGYYYYYYLALDHTKELLHLAKNLRHTLTEDQFGAIAAPMPPYREQEKISRCLDEKCAQIDELIANQQAQIEKLKQYKQSLITEVVTKGLDPNAPMKDSGVVYLGEIPFHWELIATKHLFRIESGATPQSSNPEYFGGDIPWVTPADYKTEDVFVSKGRRALSSLGLRSCSTTLVPKGSIIFSKRAPIGSVAISTEELCTNQGCLACIPKAEGELKYYYYSMSAMTEEYNLLGSGTTFKEISASNFSSFVLPRPPVDEQKRIVNFLDCKCERISELIKAIEATISKLNKYKKSIIYECVTGKKEVL